MKNGVLFWEYVSINPILNEDGVISNSIAVKQDSTPGKEAEEEIRNLNSTLELRIEERTGQLSEINGVLKLEIAERRHASNAMDKGHNRLNKIADQVPDVVYQYRVNPGGSSCFPYASELMPEIEGGIIPVRISITDTGMGIAPSNIPKLFIPFERIGAETTSTEGTVHGLVVVKKLISAMREKSGQKANRA